MLESNILDLVNVEQHLLKEFKRMMLKKLQQIKLEKEFLQKDNLDNLQKDFKWLILKYFSKTQKLLKSASDMH